MDLEAFTKISSKTQIFQSLQAANRNATQF